jgi:hypothetical protein
MNIPTARKKNCIMTVCCLRNKNWEAAERDNYITRDKKAASLNRSRQQAIRPRSYKGALDATYICTYIVLSTSQIADRQNVDLSNYLP